jgi:predicted kinase
VVIRSDETRKQLCDVDPLQRLGPEGYTAEMSQRVYKTIAHRAALAVATGQSAIVDAVYAWPADRETIERVAAAAQVPFVGLWLDAPEAVLIARSEQRRLDASDADAAVIRQQLAQDVGAVAWRRIDASPNLDDLLRTATAVLSEHLKSGVIRLASQAA